MSFKIRGLRNNNPGNIRLTNIPWDGKVPRAQNTDGQFEQFYNAEDGIRALARNLLTYYNQGRTTLAEIINRWAPPVGRDNDGNEYTQNTSAYVRSVSDKTGIDPNVTFPTGKIDSLVKAIIVHENGLNPYRDTVVNRAIQRAGWS